MTAQVETFPDNETLKRIGAFDRSCTVGKHMAVHEGHLQDTIGRLDAAGMADVADTLIWQVWHRVNDRMRHDEWMRYDAGANFSVIAKD